MPTPSYSIGDRVVIQNGTVFMKGKIEGIQWDQLSAMNRSVYSVFIGRDLDDNKRIVDCPEEIIVCLEANTITCDI